MIKPLADRVLIEPKEAETKTAGGLYIPDTAKEIMMTTIPTIAKKIMNSLKIAESLSCIPLCDTSVS